MVEILANESNYTKKISRDIKYIIIHFTANDGDTVRGNAKYFQGKDRNASAHYFVDENEVIRSVRENDIAWHCGARIYKHKYCRNENSIGIEMCSRRDERGKYYIKEKTILKTVKLTSTLIKKYKIPITNVLRHFDVTGKNCPAPFVEDEKEWRRFLILLEKENEMTLEEAKNIVKEKFGFDEKTMLYLEMYRYGDSLIKRLASR